MTSARQTGTGVTVNGAQGQGERLIMGAAARARQQGSGPAIWLAGDPEDLKDWMPLGAAGIVTNTVVLNDMVKKYGPLTELIKRYLDITDKPVVVEIDGHSTAELVEVGEVFTAMSEQIILKIPCTAYGLGAFRHFSDAGVETFCTTVFSLPQAAAVAQVGRGPHSAVLRARARDGRRLQRSLCGSALRCSPGWERRPLIMAALVRSVETAYAALRDGADEIVIFWPVFRDMLLHPLTDTWNKTFMDEWQEMDAAGKLADLPIRRA